MFCATPRGLHIVVHYSATQRHLHKPRRCLRHIQYPSDIANSVPTRTIGFSENPQ